MTQKQTEGKRIIMHSPKMRRLTQTEKLREKIAERYWIRYRDASLSSIFWDMNWATLIRRNTDNLSHLYVKDCREFADQILQACKEAELKFVPKQWLVPGQHGFATYTAEILSSINSQIEEIKL